MSPAPATPEMLAQMSACAYRLGVRYAKAAEGAEDWKRELELFNLFDRCFFAVRVSIALELRLERERRLGPREGREAGGEAEALDATLEAERAEPDDSRPERERLDADREREREPATFPVLLKTLQGVAAEAAALPGPGELPTLQDILARVTAAPSAGPPSKPEAAPLRDRLAGSAAVTVATLPPRPSPSLPGHRPTGPPPARPGGSRDPS